MMKEFPIPAWYEGYQIPLLSEKLPHAAILATIGERSDQDCLWAYIFLRKQIGAESCGQLIDMADKLRCTSMVMRFMEPGIKNLMGDVEPGKLAMMKEIIALAIESAVRASDVAFPITPTQGVN